MQKMDKAIEWLLVFLMAVLVIDVVWQVATRYILGSASSFTEEIARFLLIWIGLLGSAYAYRKNLHLAFDYLAHKLSRSVLRKLEVVIHLLIALFSFLVLVVGGSYLVQLTWELNQVSAAMQIRLAYVYSVLPISGVLIVIYSALFIRDIIGGKSFSTVGSKTEGSL
jgi:TRAP-type C4-dicarboxylate transport system permease small subunit